MHDEHTALDASGFKADEMHILFGIRVSGCGPVRNLFLLAVVETNASKCQLNCCYVLTGIFEKY